MPADADSPPVTETAKVADTDDRADSPDGVDLTLIRWMLELTPTERLEAAQKMIDAVWALRVGREA